MKQSPDTQAEEDTCLQDTCCPQTSNTLPQAGFTQFFNAAIMQSLPGGFSRPVTLDFFPSVITFSPSYLFPKLLMYSINLWKHGLWWFRRWERVFTQGASSDPLNPVGMGSSEGGRGWLKCQTGQSWTELPLILFLDCKTYPSSWIAFKLYCF